MHLLIIDNYDSFTYNLYQTFGYLDPSLELEVYKNDHLSLEQIRAKNFDKIVISPGPGSPAQEHYFGICGQVLMSLSQNIPTLGVCLGMQGICHFYGGEVISAKKPMHGKISKIQHNQDGVFKNLPQDIEVMRYHSLVVNPASLPSDLEITAKTKDQEIMGLRHKIYPIHGIQFHPESFATEGGLEILNNFLKL